MAYPQDQLNPCRAGTIGPKDHLPVETRPIFPQEHAQCNADDGIRNDTDGKADDGRDLVLIGSLCYTRVDSTVCNEHVSGKGRNRVEGGW